ncbi:uncharacterized protein LOC118572248 isoform X1 [Onychomys torridus]|uniref:uncharacterized protein LOC118572248 isoform X1 n=1 Tax=Onychomys torridus TaxID=38674 RepID=UPI00167F3FAD|nr:uncharacterized protein LOC118572248 isoform X1 [Onychomys torridus]
MRRRRRLRWGAVGREAADQCGEEFTRGGACRGSPSSVESRAQRALCTPAAGARSRGSPHRPPAAWDCWRAHPTAERSRARKTPPPAGGRGAGSERRARTCWKQGPTRPGLPASEPVSRHVAPRCVSTSGAGLRIWRCSECLLLPEGDPLGPPQSSGKQVPGPAPSSPCFGKTLNSPPPRVWFVSQGKNSASNFISCPPHIESFYVHCG